MQKRYTYPGKSKLQGSHAAEHPRHLCEIRPPPAQPLGQGQQPQELSNYRDAQKVSSPDSVVPL